MSLFNSTIGYCLRVVFTAYRWTLIACCNWCSLLTWWERTQLEINLLLISCLYHLNLIKNWDSVEITLNFNMPQITRILFFSPKNAFFLSLSLSSIGEFIGFGSSRQWIVFSPMIFRFDCREKKIRFNWMKLIA